MKIKALIYARQSLVIRDRPYFSKLSYLAIILGDEWQ